MTIAELIQKRAKGWEGAKAFVESHAKENGTLSAEDNAAVSYTHLKGTGYRF